MKKSLVMGMLAVATMSFSTAHAATTVNAKLVKYMSKYTEELKIAAFGAKGSASGLSAENFKIAEDTMINELNLSPGVSKSMRKSLGTNDAKATQRLENLTAILAAKRAAVQVATTNAAEAKSIDNAATATAKLIANSYLTGGRAAEQVKDLNKTELADTIEALGRLEQLPESIVTTYTIEQRDSYTKVLNKHDELLQSGTKGSSEEAFVQAIMDVYGLTKDKAMEKVRKLSKCE